MSTITVSALITGFPPQLRVPKPLPGETMAQLVIRNYPDEWRNCITRLEKDLHLPNDTCEQLRKGNLQGVTDARIQAEFERFMNLRLPSHGRTLQGLVDLREMLREEGSPILLLTCRYELCEILWPREVNPSGDRSAEKRAEAMGVKPISLPTGGKREMNMAELLPSIRGKYLWILPGGTRLFGPTVALGLGRVVRAFESSPRLALYSDQCFSMIYRIQVLRDLVDQGKTLSPNLQENARLLQESGYELAADNAPEARLAELEPLYGGDQQITATVMKDMIRSTKPSQQPWWKRLIRSLFGAG